MIYRCEFVTVGGSEYLTSVTADREQGRPSKDELRHSPGALLTPDGRLKWRVVRGEVLALVDDPRPPDDQQQNIGTEAIGRPAKRQAVERALPDILLAVADGGDLAEEVRKALAKAEGQRV